MSNDVVISVDHLSKRYRLGIIGTGTLAHEREKMSNVEWRILNVE